jgi:phospholipid/cholesterol/gamma-HCH transport system substrate-binding protein
VVAAASLAEQVADHDEQVSASVTGLNRTFASLAKERGAVSSSLEQLPSFLEEGTTALGSLRGALPDVDGLVDAGRTALPALRPWTGDLRRTFRALRPASRDVSDLLRKPGRSDDLVDALATLPALARTAVGTDDRGSFPTSRRALDGTLPALRFARPYSPDVLAWISDFAGESGVTDALGGIARTAPIVNPLAPLENGAAALQRGIGDIARQSGARTGQTDRCPGSLERDPGDGSTPYKPTPSFGCDVSQVPPGR